MLQTLDQIIRDSNAQVVDVIDGRPVTRGELSAQFDRVKNAEHWKNHIDAQVDVANDAEIDLIERAVVFFTGSVPHVVEVRAAGGMRTIRVRAAGYFRTIGA